MTRGGLDRRYGSAGCTKRQVREAGEAGKAPMEMVDGRCQPSTVVNPFHYMEDGYV